MLLALTSFWRNSQVAGDLNSYDARYIKILTCKIVVSSAHLWGPIITHSGFPKSLQWRHNERDGGSNHRLLDCLINRLISRSSKKASKLRVDGLCEGIPPVTSRFPSQRASNAENVSIWWRHHDSLHGYSWKQDMDYSWVYTSVRCYVQYRVKFDTLRWRHNDHAGVSNHQPHGCLLNRLFRRKSKKTSKLRVTGLCAGNSPGTGEFPAQMASYAENVSIWWRHHAEI